MLSQLNGNTPVSNTGVNLTDTVLAGLDWLSGTFNQANFDEVKQFLETAFADSFVQKEKGIGYYSRSWRSTCGAVLGSHPYGENPRTDAYLSLPASVLGLLPLHEQQKVFAGLCALGVRSSRLDMRIDCYGEEFTLTQVEEAAQAGNFGGFQSFRCIQSGNGRLARISRGLGVGRTIEFGRRGKSGSGKFIRIYDKAIESAGKIDAIRIELELSGERSSDCFSILAQSPVECWGQLIAGWIKDAIKFVDRSVSERVDRCPMLPWWEALLGAFERLSLSVHKPEPVLEKVKRWVKKQVAPSLSMVLEYCHRTGEDWFEWIGEIIADGDARLSDKHYALISTAMMQT